jgi:hypothetical protein
LLGWINYLAGLSEEQTRLAKAKIERAERLGLRGLTLRRLTHSQYNATVRDLVGDQSQPANGFPREDFIHGFKNQPEGQGIPPLLAEGYSSAAERLARNTFRGGDHQGLIPCEPASAQDLDCAGRFVKQFGLKAYRRPLTGSEADVFLEMFRQEAGRTGDFLGGAQMVVEAMLQSPHFLFVVERGPGNPFEQYEVASRLSYFLWDTMPSDEMLLAAGKGEFSSVEQIEAAVRSMLRDPRAKLAMDEFLAQWLRFDRTLTAIRDRRMFPNFSADTAIAMTEETRHLFNHLVWEDKDFREFFNADYTFLSSDLAKLYGLPAPVEEFARANYSPDSGRAGVLSHGSILTLTSKPSETSPTERGLFIREHFLCHRVPAPPPGVNTALPEITEDKPMTNRERLQIHLNSPACSSCHRLNDPIGLGLEQYDAVGGYREQLVLSLGRGRRRGGERPPDLKLDINTTGIVQGIANSEFSSPKELGQILANEPTCQKCVVKQLFRYAFGREETVADQPAIDRMLAKFRDSGFRFQELIVSVVTSDLFLEKEALRHHGI